MLAFQPPFGLGWRWSIRASNVNAISGGVGGTRPP